MIVGWVLTHPNLAVFEKALKMYDKIEQYNPQAPESSLYKRSLIDAYLEEEYIEQYQKIGESGQKVKVYIYHKDKGEIGEEIQGGDWLNRKRI